MMKMCAALWGSQSWLQPAFSRPSAGHEGSLMAQEPPERRLRARLPAPRLFSDKAPPCPSERSSDIFGGACFSLPSERSSDRPSHLPAETGYPCPLSRRYTSRLPPLDRKSTRLNSSHLGISYAVFCLKKKN